MTSFVEISYQARVSITFGDAAIKEASLSLESRAVGKQESSVCAESLAMNGRITSQGRSMTVGGAARSVE